MYRYVFVLILLIGLAIINGGKLDDNIKTKKYIVFASIILVFQSSMRHIGVGSDTYQYYCLYNDALSYSYKELFYSAIHFDLTIHKDPFYYFVSKLFHSVFHSFRLFLLFIAIIYFSCLGVLLRNFLKTPAQAFLAYLFYMGMFYGLFSITMLRQTIAVAIVYFAYLQLTKKRIVIYVILTFLAILFHKSAFISFALVFVLLKLNRGELIFLLLFLFPVLFAKRFELALFFMGNDDAYSTYAQGAMGYYEVGSLPILMLYFVFFVGIIVTYKKLINEGLANEIMLYLITMAFLPLIYVEHSSFRISLYFSFSMFILLPYIIDNLNIGVSQSGKYIITTIVLLFFMYFAIAPNDYAFFWQQYETHGIRQKPKIDPTYVNFFE